jgi:predicted RNA-binding Zn ribbon-like protein
MVTRSAPEALEVVRAFVNTRDVEAQTDSLTRPGDLRAWLTQRDLLGRRKRVTAADLEHARTVREALRALLAANNGEPLDPAAPAVLDRAARRAGLVLRFRPDGTAGEEPSARGVDGALGRLLAAVAAAMADGTWPRLKVCRDPGCAWAFYDAARNRSRAWCSMAVCGNRAKARAYRRRRSTA